MYNTVTIWETTPFKDHVWGKLFLHTYIEDIHFLPEAKIAEDVLYNLACLCVNPYVDYAYIDEALYYYYNRSGSLVKTFKGDDLIPVVDGMTTLLSKSENVSRLIVATEIIKYGLSARYLTMFQPNYKQICSDLKFYFEIALRTLRKCGIHTNKLLLFYIFVYSPLIYRLFRIATDHTLIQWEKQQRKLYSK